MGGRHADGLQASILDQVQECDGVFFLHPLMRRVVTAGAW
jgi:hypothetical protein